MQNDYKKSPDNQGFWLSYQDSNLDKLIQSQMCYRYTIGHCAFRSLEIGCKSTHFFYSDQIFLSIFCRCLFYCFL